MFKIYIESKESLRYRAICTPQNGRLKAHQCDLGWEGERGEKDLWFVRHPVKGPEELHALFHSSGTLFQLGGSHDCSAWERFNKYECRGYNHACRDRLPGF